MLWVGRDLQRSSSPTPIVVFFSAQELYFPTGFPGAGRDRLQEEFGNTPSFLLLNLKLTQRAACAYF